MASDEQVQRYVDALDFERDDLFGIYNRRLDLIAMAHVAFAPADQPNDCAEFGVSVASHAAAATVRGCSSAPWSRPATKASACFSSMR